MVIISYCLGILVFIEYQNSNNCQAGMLLIFLPSLGIFSALSSCFLALCFYAYNPILISKERFFFLVTIVVGLLGLPLSLLQPF